MNAPLRFFEYDKVAYKGKWEKPLFKKEHYEAFENYYNENPETPFFELIPYGVRFKQYVGAIQIGKTTIEVLPKVGKQGDENTWQSVLLDMLKTCNLLTAKQTGEAQLKLRANSVLELYFELFINEIDTLCRRGLIKKYQPKSGQNKTLKGAIQFPKNIAKNTVHKERFYINYTTYTKDHLLHQILFEALKVVDLVSMDVL
jgi:5-methylcytosine-specific restriction enzyme subunit McrC